MVFELLGLLVKKILTWESSPEKTTKSAWWKLKRKSGIKCSTNFRKCLTLRNWLNEILWGYSSVWIFKNLSATKPSWKRARFKSRRSSAMAVRALYRLKALKTPPKYWIQMTTFTSSLVESSWPYRKSMLRTTARINKSPRAKTTRHFWISRKSPVWKWSI